MGYTGVGMRKYLNRKDVGKSGVREGLIGRVTAWQRPEETGNALTRH